MGPHRLRLRRILKSNTSCRSMLKTFQLDPISGAPEAAIARMKTALTVVVTIRAVNISS